MKNRAVLGIDIGGTKTLCLLTNEKHQVLERIKFKTSGHEGKSAFERKLLQATRELRRHADKAGLELIAIGVGSAGSVDPREKTIITSPNLLSLEKFPIGKILKKAHGVEVILGNDVQVGIYGEYKLGAAQGCAHVLGVFFGTGVGGAAIISGKIHTGASGVGGQIGSVLAQPVGGREAALSHGIVDRIASKAAIAGEALVMAVKEWAPYLHRKVGTDLSKVTWGLLRRAIEKGDERIDEMLRARMRVVGIALSDIVNFLNPDMVVLGGGLVGTFPKLVLEEFEQGLREHLGPEVSKALKVRPAKLGGDVVALGAAYLAFEEANRSFTEERK